MAAGDRKYGAAVITTNTNWTVSQVLHNVSKHRIKQIITSHKRNFSHLTMIFSGLFANFKASYVPFNL